MPRSRPRSRCSAQQGAILVDIKKFDDKRDRQERACRCCMTELKADMAKYLKSSPAPIGVAHARRPDRLRQGARAAGDGAVRPGDCSSRPRRPRASTIRPTRRRARPASRRRARTGSTGCSRTIDVVALVGPTMPPAWKIDAVNGDQISRRRRGRRSPRSPAIRTSPCRWAW